METNFFVTDATLAPMMMQTLPYGPLPEQKGDLYLPGASRPSVVCLLHGGFWRSIYHREQMSAIASDLASRGFAVWNLEYRGLGASGGGWPGTLSDVAAGIDHLATLVDLGIDLALDSVVVAGHSAGGHLALWSPARDRSSGSGVKSSRVRLAATAGLAPVADLVRAYELRLGNGVVGDFLGGSPGDQTERYQAASPIALLPLGIPQLIVHGTADDTVPIQIARDYASAARAAGDTVNLAELPGRGHFDFLDPASEAHAILCRWLTSLRPSRT